MQVEAALKTASQRLQAAGCDTPRLDAEVLLAYVTRQDKGWLLARPDYALDAGQQKEFLALVARREQREPVAYLTGCKSFFGLDFYVTPDVLIPRPETELLVETALHLAAANAPLTIVDVGTGSGCIAISLARHLLQARLFAVDVSAPALAVARQNASRHQVLPQITFLQGDLLAPISEPVDLIVSNPPYLSRADLQASAAMPEVVRYEPRLALNGGPDGLAAIRQLLARAQQTVKPGGTILVEIGFNQGPEVIELAQIHFSTGHIQILPDLAGLDRLLVIKT